MKITYEKLKEFQDMARAHRKSLYERFVQAHEVMNNQNTSEIKVIAEYNFWGGYDFAILKIEQLKRLKPSDESDPPIISSNHI